MLSEMFFYCKADKNNSFNPELTCFVFNSGVEKEKVKKISYEELRVLYICTPIQVQDWIQYENPAQKHTDNYKINVHYTSNLKLLYLNIKAIVWLRSLSVLCHIMIVKTNYMETNFSGVHLKDKGQQEMTSSALICYLSVPYGNKTFEAHL